MKKLVIILAVLFGVVVLFVGTVAYNAGGLSADHLIRAVLNFRFGNFGGQRSSGSRPFDPDATKFAIRWYPTFVSFGPDNDTLLVSLCHVDNNSYCRIAKHSLSQDKWDIYAYDEAYNYRWPTFSPDGQWIYYGATKLCEDRRNFCGRPQMFRMRPDGTGVEMFFDESVVDFSFSVDGKRMIYWGRPSPNALLANEVHMLDIAKRQDTRLTDMTSMISQPRNRPFLTADGEHFIFPADISEWQGTTSCAVDPKTISADPKTGKKDFGPLFGDKENTGLYLAAIKDAPITRDNCYKLTPIWGKDSGHAGGLPCAMDGQGRFVYASNLGDKKRQGNPVALALRPADSKATYLTQLQEDEKFSASKLTDEHLRQGEGVRLFHQKWIEERHGYREGAGPALFLRKLDGTDEAAFDLPQFSPHADVSADGSLLAFIQPENPAGPTVYSALGLLTQGQSFKDVRYVLNWPKLDLIPTLPTER